MVETQFDESLKVLAGAADRRDALRSLGAAGMAVLAGLSLTDAAARKKSRGGGKGRGQKNKGRQRNRPHSNGRPQDATDDTEDPDDDAATGELVLNAERANLDDPRVHVPIVGDDARLASGEADGIAAELANAHREQRH